ncbi:PA14 domain-containing protein [Paenibacillus sp. NPDC058071]|uniref:PA14 domain-containing protein n=1 Tax=Paenibacillus sp. NPDC058071 TaxID=3346326 RepID=UPI0036D79081
MRKFSLAAIAFLLASTLLVQPAQTHATSTPFDQGAGYGQGGYDTSADQPTDFNWTRHSRFNGVNANLHTKWTFPVLTNFFRYDPSIGSDGTIYVATEHLQTPKLLAINPNGTLKWEYPLKYPAASAPSIGADGYVYLTAGAYVYGVNAITGQSRWSTAYFDPNVASLTSLAIGQDGTLYFGNARRQLLAVNPSAPSIKWITNIGHTMSQPSIDSNGVIYVQSIIELKVQLTAINPNGSIKWSNIYHTSNTYETLQYSSALLDELGNIYIGGNSGKKLYSIKASDGTINWTKDLPGVMNASPAYNTIEKTLYIGINGLTTHLIALNLDGTEKWNTKLLGTVRTSPIIDAKGNIFVYSSTVGINVVSKEGQVITTFIPTPSHAGNNIAIGSDGTLYFTCQNKLVYAIGGDIVLPETPGTPEPVNGLKGEYFNNDDLTDKKFERVDSQIDFDWGYGSPHELIDPETYSVRWTGKIQPAYTDYYTFHATVDDGVRLWINDQLIIDRWDLSDIAEFTGSIHLNAGQKYDIRMEYFNRPGYGFSRLEWSSELQNKEIIPTSALFLE